VEGIDWEIFMVSRYPPKSRAPNGFEAWQLDFCGAQIPNFSTGELIERRRVITCGGSHSRLRAAPAPNSKLPGFAVVSSDSQTSRINAFKQDIETASITVLLYQTTFFRGAAVKA